MTNESPRRQGDAKDAKRGDGFTAEGAEDAETTRSEERRGRRVESGEKGTDSSLRSE